MLAPDKFFPTTGTVSGTVDAVCRRRTELLDRLAGTIDRIGRGKLAFKSSLEDLDTAASDCIQGEVLRLRHECEVIRAELGEHRAAHGC
jgi:hypothetical protein